MRRTSLVFLLVLLAGCQVTGKRVDEAHLLQFEKGRTTYFEVLTALGPPTSAALLADGTRHVVYSYTQMQQSGWNYFPIARRFVGGGTTEHTQAVLEFDAQGILVGWSHAQGQDKTGTGFIGGQKQ